MRFSRLFFYASLSFGAGLSLAQNPDKSADSLTPRTGTPPVRHPLGSNADSSRKERIMFGGLE